MVDLTPVKNGIDVLEKLGVLEKLSLKLINNPDKAAKHLNLALAELDTGYSALHDEMIELGTLSFAPKSRKDTHKRLLRIKDGRIADEVNSVRGSCTRIWNIYQMFLSGWFSRVLVPREADDLHSLFVVLASMDSRFINAVDILSSKAQQFAVEVLTHLDNGDALAAESLVKGFEKELAPMREQLTNSMKQLWKLQDKFIEVGRVV